MIPYTFVFATQFPYKKLSTLLLPGHTLLCHSEDTAKVTLLDTFDQELQASGKILLQKDDGLLLLDTNNGQVIGQAGAAKMLCTPDIVAGTVKTGLASISKLRAFLPIAELTFHSTTRMMLDDEGKTVARLHSFVFTKKKKVAQIVVSQPLRGYNDEYETLVKAVQAICTNTTTLYEALGVKTANYCAKPNISLDSHAPIIETTGSIITTFIDVARQNEKGVQQDYDTEFLHDYRVSFRKVRSVISLFKGVYAPEITQQLKDDFASIMQITGRLRDLDVYLLDKSYYYSLVPSTTHHGLNLMFSLFEKERAKVHKNICSSLKSKRYKKKIQTLRESFALNTFDNGPLTNEKSLEFACKIILKRYNKVCTIARQIDKNTEDEIVHELRIHCKKLRYLMEFFTPLFHRNKIKTLIKSLKVLQDNLGRFNDYSVQQESLSVFLAEHPLKGTDRIKVAESIGALTAMLNMLQQKERNLVMKNFLQFDNRDTRMLFDNLFSIKG